MLDIRYTRRVSSIMNNALWKVGPPSIELNADADIAVPQVKADAAARRVNVSCSMVHRLWNQYQTEASVSRRHVPGRPRVTTPSGDRFIALAARRRRRIYVPQLVADHSVASGRRTSATTVPRRLHNSGLYARFTLESDSGRLLIWRERSTRYQSNTVDRHSYRGGGIMVWAGISLEGHKDLHVFHGGTLDWCEISG
ncbi:transposable element Tcb2 transposase [Trichonephila clavipes]|nr:transposable element Tcb2 transposase [Trichonephila clavipes]